jgi:hypothetical protein
MEQGIANRLIVDRIKESEKASSILIPFQVHGVVNSCNPASHLLTVISQEISRPGVPEEGVLRAQKVAFGPVELRDIVGVALVQFVAKANERSNLPGTNGLFNANTHKPFLNT